MSALSDKLAAKKMPHRDVTICLDGALALEREEAYKALREATLSAKRAEEGKGDTRMVGAGLKNAKKTVDEVEARMRDAALTIRITAVSFGEYNKFVIQNPPRKGKDETFNPQTFFMALARRSGEYVDDDGKTYPITSQEWDEIESSLTDGDHDRIAQAIVTVNRQDSLRGIDFTLGGSEMTRSSSES